MRTAAYARIKRWVCIIKSQLLLLLVALLTVYFASASPCIVNIATARVRVAST